MSKLIALKNIQTYITEYLYCICDNNDTLATEDIYNFKCAKEFYEWADKQINKQKEL